jgi:hypothetical protein
VRLDTHNVVGSTNCDLATVLRIAARVRAKWSERRRLFGESGDSYNVI